MVMRVSLFLKVVKGISAPVGRGSCALMEVVFRGEGVRGEVGGGRGVAIRQLPTSEIAI